MILDKYRVNPSKGAKESNHFYVRLSGLDLKKATTITISEPSLIIELIVVFISGKGKTIFLSYENGTLRPQSGKGIFSKKTKSGLNLTNNVTDKDMTIESESKSKKEYEKYKKHENLPAIVGEDILE